MDNGNLEDQVLNNNKRQGSGKRVFLIVAGLLILGIVSLYGGIKIFSRLSISASTDTPPQPAEPVAGTDSTTPTSDEPPVPPEPGGTVISVTVPAGWSMISGNTLSSRDMSPFAKANIFVYSFNEPSPGFQNRNWTISNPDFANQADYSQVTSSLKFWPHPALGYYVYNPGSATTLELAKLTSTRPTTNLVFARGWHLLYWSGSAVTRDDLLKRVTLKYNDQTSENLSVATGEASHKASVKIYVVVKQNDVGATSIKELTNKDSKTTISKVPSNSYYWVYFRRTKSRVSNIIRQGTIVSPTPTPSATSSLSLPPVPNTPTPQS